MCSRWVVQEERNWVNEGGRRDFPRKGRVLQHTGSDGGAEGVGHDNSLVLCSVVPSHQEGLDLVGGQDG